MVWNSKLEPPTRRRLEPARREPEVLGELHLVHPAVAGAREPVDVGLLESGVVERAPERLRLEHRAAQVRGNRTVGQSDSHDTHVALHGAAT